MVHAAVQAGARGLFFYRFDHAKTDANWLQTVYAPVVNQLLSHSQAFHNGPLLDRPYVRVTGDAQVVATLYASKRNAHILLLVHHGAGVVKPTLRFDASLGVRKLLTPEGTTAAQVAKNTAEIDLDDYEARVLVLVTT